MLWSASQLRALRRARPDRPSQTRSAWMQRGSGRPHAKGRLLGGATERRERAVAVRWAARATGTRVGGTIRPRSRSPSD